MFRTSIQGDLTALTALWQVCFGDEPSYIAQYFHHAWKPKRVFVAAPDGKPQAMAAWFPCRAGGQPAAYFYAVCTAPDWRGQGLCRKLMAYAQQQLQSRGICQFLLVPGEKSLFQFYQTMGYTTAGTIGERTISNRAETPLLPVQQIAPEEYLRRREQALTVQHVCWDLDEIRYQQQLSRFSGGDLFAIGSHGCAAAEKMPDGRLLCKELLGCSVEEGAAALLQAFHVESGLFRYPDSTGRPFCMGLGLQASPVYLGFAFD